MQPLSIVLAVLASLLVSGILLVSARVPVLPAFEALFGGAFGSWRALTEDLVRATPLILTGLATVVAFKARVWNIGAEGQLLFGAMGAYLAYTLFGGLPPVVLFFLVVVLAFAGGAAYGALAAILKIRFRVDEIISTVMLNYVAFFFLSLMLSGMGPWREEGSFYQQTAKLPEAVHFWILLPRTRLHVGFIIAVVAAGLLWVLLKKTPLGYEIRGYGFNPTASRFKGTNPSEIVMLTMAISGGLAGLAGASELFGLQHRLGLDISSGLGYTGIIVAMLAGLNPLGVILAASLFGGLVNGAYRLQVLTGVPSAFIYSIQAIVLLFVLSASVANRYHLRRVSDAD